ncbi:MAG TPA: hypothetical protein VIN39_06025 [Candidatus Dormibacteraeota bacterium]
MSSIDAEVRTSDFQFASLAEGWEFWERTNAPQAAMKSMFPPAAYSAIVQREVALMRDLNSANDGTLRLSWDWLLVRARKAS